MKALIEPRTSAQNCAESMSYEFKRVKNCHVKAPKIFALAMGLGNSTIFHALLWKKVAKLRKMSSPFIVTLRVVINLRQENRYILELILILLNIE